MIMYCIIVFYNPSIDIVKKWEYFIIEHPYISFVIVDNSVQNNWDVCLNNCTYIPLHENKGIATAQNEGISHAIKCGGKHIIFFDQDSEVEASYCDSMFSEYGRIKQQEPTLAILGPTIVNKETNATYKTCTVDNELGYSLTNCLISSGTIVETRILKEVGLMEDILFIDAVDFEWCWRACSKGYKCAMTSNVELPHKVGQNSKTFLGLPFIISSPFRYFYQYRNWIWLLHRSYVPRSWKIRNSVRRIAELFIIPLLADKKYETVLNMLKGLTNGIGKHCIA